jgi:hypothetical protein
MDVSEAIGLLAEVDNGQEAIKVINAKIAELSKAEKKTKNLEAAIAKIIETSGAEGTDLNSQLDSAAEKIKTLSDQLRQSDEKLTASTQKLAQLERGALIGSAAQKVGAVPEVLQRLLKPEDDLVVGEDGVIKIGGKELKEYTSSNPDWKPFIPALFPSAETTTTNSTTRLPNAGGNGDDKKADPVANYMKNRYPVPDYLKETK